MLVLSASFLAAFGLASTAAGQAPPSTIPTDRDPNRWVDGLYSQRDLLEVGSVARLLKLPPIRTELKVTQTQLDRVAAVERKARATAFSSILAPGEVLSREEMNERMVRRLHEGDVEVDAQIQTFLTKAQYRRLIEIVVQVEGPMSLARAEIQTALNFDPGQRLRVAKIVDEYRARRTANFRSGGKLVNGDRDKPIDLQARQAALGKDEVRKRLETLRDELRKTRSQVELRLLGVLTKRQRAAFEKLSGEKFEHLEATQTPGLDWKRYEAERAEPKSGEKAAPPK